MKQKRLLVVFWRYYGTWSLIHSQEIGDIVFTGRTNPKNKASPFSDAVQVGDLFFSAGQIGMDHTTRTMVGSEI